MEDIKKVILSHTNGIEATWGKNKTKGKHRDQFWDQSFFIHINDLPKLASIGAKILLYADDTI